LGPITQTSALVTPIQVSRAEPLARPARAAPCCGSAPAPMLWCRRAPVEVLTRRPDGHETIHRFSVDNEDDARTTTHDLGVPEDRSSRSPRSRSALASTSPSGAPQSWDFAASGGSMAGSPWGPFLPRQRPAKLLTERDDTVALGMREAVSLIEVNPAAIRRLVSRVSRVLSDFSIPDIHN
jgi:hypothetical protein